MAAGQLVVGTGPIRGSNCCANITYRWVAKAPAHSGQHVVKTVEEWHLPSDPWTFVVDRTGVVRDRFEGAAPIDELEPALKAVLS